MTIHIKSTAQVAKGFSVKREKRDDETEIAVAHLKIGEVLISRDELDEVCGQPVGWSSSALFDEFAAPRAHLTLTLHRVEWTATGVISGGTKSTDPRLRVKDAEVDSLTLELTKLGALLACQLSWVAEGDEVDDVADLLGQLCAVDLVLTDSGQRDMLRDVAAQAVDSIRQLAQQDGVESIELRDGDGNTLAKFGKDAA